MSRGRGSTGDEPLKKMVEGMLQSYQLFRPKLPRESNLQLILQDQEIPKNLIVTLKNLIDKKSIINQRQQDFPRILAQRHQIPKEPTPGGSGSMDSFQIPIPGTSVDGKETPINTSDMDMQIDIPLPEAAPIVKSQQRILRAESRNLEEELISGEGLYVLDYFKNFCMTTLCVEGKYQAGNLLRAFCLKVFELLHVTGQEDQVIQFKNQLLHTLLDKERFVHLCPGVLQNGSENIEQRQLKCLFLEFIYRVFEDASVEELINNFEILQDLLVLVVVTYTTNHLPSQDGEPFKGDLSSMKPQTIYPLFSRVFGLEYSAQKARFCFWRGERSLVIERGQEGFTSWIE